MVPHLFQILCRTNFLLSRSLLLVTHQSELWTVTQTGSCTVQTWHYELWAVPTQFLTPDCAADEAWNQANWSPGQSSSGQLSTPDSALVNVRRNLSSEQPVTCNPADVEAEN